VEKVNFAFGDHVILRDFSTTIMRGDKLGIIGPNGIGKTTLLRVLLGQLPPQSGSVRTGTNLEVAYFDQLRGQLEDNKTVQDNVGEGSDTVQINGRGQHVIGYLQNFLFTPERSRTEVRFLSGGERNRVLLAKLFTKPANVLVLDEPTNDLDTETLELLENQLVEFSGTLLLVSHDRAFLNNVVTSTIVFDQGTVREYDGGYDDWLRQRVVAAVPSTNKAKSTREVAKPKKQGAEQRRLSYNEQRELAALPDQIDDLETKIAELHQAMAEPGFYQQSGDAIVKQQGMLKQLEEELAMAYRRWEELE
jgi:ATP-binding cassette subfamily F protein uup